MSDIIRIKHNGNDELIDEITCQVPCLLVGDYLIIPTECKNDIDLTELGYNEEVEQQLQTIENTLNQNDTVFDLISNSIDYTCEKLDIDSDKVCFHISVEQLDE